MFRAPLRLLAFGNHALVWLSSLIVMGILSYFLKSYKSAHSTHIIYEETIATITFAVWTLGMILPLIDRYGGHLWPVNLVLSYLWLTSFIFSVQDWARGRCTSYSDGFGKCGLKKTVVAFNFFAFFFMFSNVIVESILFHKHRNERVLVASANGRKTNGVVDPGPAAV
ncbi:MARVEL-like domain protein [Akanthomyces lecanii RCEF 1005]|uniref:MARVEL-like domain protein n=1 Tax=Akanthomyces lecanii RCEF 1005 TaxID=1081108 RepID=A0A168I9U2_CORDF|nr:MARVEL-like domain protein [Akanthomyces lecanii RCEF 1005]